MGIVVFQVSGQACDEFPSRGEIAALQEATSQGAEPQFDLVQSRTVLGREVKDVLVVRVCQKGAALHAGAQVALAERQTVQLCQQLANVQAPMRVQVVENPMEPLVVGELRRNMLQMGGEVYAGAGHAQIPDELPGEADGGVENGIAGGRSLVGRFFAAAVDAIGFALQLHDRGAIDDAIQHGHRQGASPRYSAQDSKSMFVTRAVLTRWLRASMILYHKLAACGQTAAFDAIEAEFVNDEQAELGVEANAVVDGLVGQGGGEVFEEFAAGDVTDALFEHARGQADALDQPAFSQAGLADEDDVLLAADEVALGQGFDLQTRDGGIEVPVEGAPAAGLRGSGRP